MISVLMNVLVLYMSNGWSSHHDSVFPTNLSENTGDAWQSSHSDDWDD